MITDPKLVRRLCRSKSKKNDTPTPYVSCENRFTKNSQYELWQYCSILWSNLQSVRENRNRAKKYYQGDQWHELIRDPDTGYWMREEDYIRNQGRIPFKQNVIYSIVNNVLGQFRGNPTKTLVVSKRRDDQRIGEMLSNAVQSVHNLNDIDELDADNLKEYLLAGMAITKTVYQRFPQFDRPDVLCCNVNTNNIFFNAGIADPRVEMQLNIIGEIIDTDIDTIVAQFAKNKAEEAQIRQIYGVGGYSDNLTPSSKMDGKDVENMSFETPNDLTLCRVWEVWRKESAWRIHYHDYADGTWGVTDLNENQLKAINLQRIEQALGYGIPEEEVSLIEFQKAYDQFWVVRYLGPNGECLYESETPYQHDEHPYNISMFAVDGKPISLVETIIDQQRYINRMMNFLDKTLGEAAKNVMIVPEHVIPEGMDLKTYSDAMTRTNSVISYKIEPNMPSAKPEFISSSSSDVGANNLLNMQLGLIKEISGITSAIQGQEPKGGTPSALYAEQAQNATLNIKNGLDIFNALREKRDKKVVKLITQFYEDGRMISNASFKTKEEIYVAKDAYGVEVDLVISKGENTPAFRQLTDGILMQLLQGNLIDIKTFLSNSSIPNADSILESVEAWQKQVQQEQMRQQLMMAGQANGQMLPLQPQPIQ